MSVASRLFQIVVAEDNPADVALVREALASHRVPCVLHVMRDGEQALKHIEQLDQNPAESNLDLVLLDMHLPRYDGEAVLARLRRSQYFAQTPVIVMTSVIAGVLQKWTSTEAPLIYFEKPSSLDEYLQLGQLVLDLLGQPHANALMHKETAGGTK